MINPVVAPNKVVFLTYTLRNPQGEIVEHRDLPVAYVHGAADSPLLPKLEQVLAGHAVGDRITLTLGPEDAFGTHDPGLTFTDDLENVPPELRQIGKELEAQNSRGATLTFVVTRVADGKLTVDANHPLAGQTLTFNLQVAAIRDATADEIRAGRPDAEPQSLQ